MAWYERRFSRLWGLEWATTMWWTGILVPELLRRDESLSLRLPVVRVISDMEVELLPGNIWAQAEGISVFLDGFTEDWEDDVSFVVMEQKAL
eukprot:3880796-Ditylum_brightwellii.AAC.1